MSRIIVTGSEGFIGKNFLKSVKDKFTVITINEDIFDNKNWIEELQQILDDTHPIAIFHFGACSDTLETDVNYMMTRNYEFTKILSDYCFKKDTRIVYSSSAANYGINGLYPSNLYGWSKYAAEQYVIQNGGVALRYFNVYGPGEEHKGRMASVAYQMMQKYKAGESVKLFPGKPKRDFVYVDDVVDANLHAYKNYDELQFNWFEVGSGKARPFEDVLDILGIVYTHTPESDIPEGYQFFTESDSSKWMTGWTPKYTLEAGLEKYKNSIK
jgi:ADP-L-glycero-D-manno-heptose 6-epimerase